MSGLVLGGGGVSPVGFLNPSDSSTDGDLSVSVGLVPLDGSLGNSDWTTSCVGLIHCNRWF